MPRSQKINKQKSDTDEIYFIEDDDIDEDLYD